jgi:hypothetical protein
VVRELLIGSRDVEHLSLHVLRREHEGAGDYWDGNWVIARIDLAVGAFTASVAASLRMDEIQHLNAGLKVMQQTVFGTAVLDSIEDWIELEIQCDAGGHLSISGWLSDAPGSGNRLSFELPGKDQTYLPDWIDSLDAIEGALPVLGSP